MKVPFNWLKDYVDIDIKAKTGSGNIVSVPKNDICYILIYKILFWIFPFDIFFIRKFIYNFKLIYY